MSKRLEYFSREKYIYIILSLVMIIVFGKLIWYQVVDSAVLKSKGIERRTMDAKLTPKRGTIYDAQGHVLAQSIPAKQIYADPKTITQLIEKKQINLSKKQIADQVGTILNIKPETIIDKLNQAVSWVNIAHQVDMDKADKISALKIPGIGMSDEDKRVYPMDSLAASALGIVNLAGHGVEGIEGYYDDELFGKSGYTSQEQDTGSRSILDTTHQNDPPQNGDNIKLTLDSTIQYLIEQQLDDLEKETRANSVTILAMDPMTGKVLGMGSRPTFNPNIYANSSPENRRPRAIGMSYEPGSTFKIITGSAALEEGAIKPEDKFNDPGYLKVGPRLIANWDSDLKPHGNITVTQGMELSSNVVLAQVGMKLGMDSFYTYLKAFGFGAKTGIGILGEQSGLILPEDKAREIDLATMSFGQTNLVTPIQLLTAISAVANGGTLYKPYIVDQITTPDGKVVKNNKPQPVRKVVSQATAKQMTKILEQVVSEGTGHLAEIPGIKVAGKTGTAQKVDSETGEYSKTDFIASFTAFAPAENPKIAVLIVIDTPRGESHQGGTLGAPKAKAIIQGALEYYGIPFDKETQSTVSVTSEDPDVRPLPQTIKPEREILQDEVVVPDLTGLTMRQAGQKLAELKLHYNFTGSGLVYKQKPQAGSIVTKGSRVEVNFIPLKNNP